MSNANLADTESVTINTTYLRKCDHVEAIPMLRNDRHIYCSECGKQYEFISQTMYLRENTR